MQKMLLLILLFVLNLVGAESERDPLKFHILDYFPEAQTTLAYIAFNDYYHYFIGSSTVLNKTLDFGTFYEETQRVFASYLHDSSYVKRIMLFKKGIVGFSIISKSRELSLESLKRAAQEQYKIAVDEEEVIAQMPHIKKTDAECPEVAKIEGIAVIKGFRRLGIGKILLLDALSQIKKMDGQPKKVIAEMNCDNTAARKLFERVGFSICPVQPAHIALIGGMQYEKEM